MPNPQMPFDDDDGDPADRARLVAEGRAGDNAPALSVSELSGAIKGVVEDRFGRVRVRGEISGFKRAASGHLYCALKDNDAVIDAVMWKGSAARLAFRPEDGVEVIATGRVTTFAGRSKYQIVMDRMELAGEGALLAMLERLRQRLKAEGLFERRRDLPRLPRVIGVVTSPTGAVIRDILHRLSDRFPVHVLVWPVRVQGDGAAAEVARAVAGFSAVPETGGAIPRPDLVIVARGGGSIEDLWAFNEEAVVRAIAASTIPIISAVGHETDTTLADHAADSRAPTPTAAAEMAVPVRADLLDMTGELGLRLTRAVRRIDALARERFAVVARRLPAADRLYGPQRQRVDDLSDRLTRAGRTMLLRARDRWTHGARALRPGLLDQRVAAARSALDLATRRMPDPQGWTRRRAEQLALLDARLTRAGQARVSRARDGFRIRADGLRPELMVRGLRDRRARLDALWRIARGLDPRQLLEKGWAMVLAPDGRVVTRAAAARSEGALDLTFADGTVRVHPADGGAPKAARPTPRPVPPGKGSGPQGSLF